MVSITSIAIPEPNVPLKDKHGNIGSSTPYFEVWQSTGDGECKPASTKMNPSGKTQLRVTIDGPPPAGEGYTLSGKFLGKFLKDTVIETKLTIEDAVIDSEKSEVDVTISGGLENVPWGVRDTIEWSINNEKIAETPLELYAITPYLPKYFQEQIPAELLEVFVLPTINTKVVSFDDYVKYTTTLCHKSSLDPDVGKSKDYKKRGFTESQTELAEALDEMKAIHSFEYGHDIAGESKYTGRTGGKFNLKVWLERRNEKDCHVNCYDQAGIVNIVLSLALTNDGTELVWYYMKPYGYIDGDLVGCGRCNNPYFGEISRKGERATNPNNQTRAGAERMVPDHDPRRSGFTDHVFSGLKKAGEEARIIDACAGPHIGSQSLADYIADAIVLEENAPPRWDNTIDIEPDSRTIWCERGTLEGVKSAYEATLEPYGITSVDI